MITVEAVVFNPGRVTAVESWNKEQSDCSTKYLIIGGVSGRDKCIVLLLERNATISKRNTMWVGIATKSTLYLKQKRTDYFLFIYF